MHVLFAIPGIPGILGMSGLPGLTLMTGVRVMWECVQSKECLG